MLQRVCEPRLVTAGRTLYGVSSFAALVATRVLYMEERRGQDPDPCYAREFDARILERGPDFVVLDQTLFYAEGGGQPDDTGTLRWEGGEARILRVTKEKGVVKHHVDRMPAAEEVHGVVDWDRRDKKKRVGTSQHPIAAVLFRSYGGRAGGTHLKNVSEIGTVHILEKRSKGKETDRIVYELVSG